MTKKYMITIAFKMTIKNEKVEEFKEVVIKQLTDSAKLNNSLEYNFYQSLGNPQEFILHEKWVGQNSLNNHLDNLVKIFGEKAKNSILPQELEDYFETTEDISYKQQ